MTDEAYLGLLSDSDRKVFARVVPSCPRPRTNADREGLYSDHCRCEIHEAEPYRCETYKIKNAQVIEIVQAWVCQLLAAIGSYKVPFLTGTNQIYPLGSPMSAEIKVPMAETTGMGQKERP